MFLVVALMQGKTLGFSLGGKIATLNGSTVLPVILQHPFGSGIVTTVKGETVVIDFHLSVLLLDFGFTIVIASSVPNFTRLHKKVVVDAFHNESTTGVKPICNMENRTVRLDVTETECGDFTLTVVSSAEFVVAITDATLADNADILPTAGQHTTTVTAVVEGDVAGTVVPFL